MRRACEGGDAVIQVFAIGKGSKDRRLLRNVTWGAEGKGTMGVGVTTVVDRQRRMNRGFPVAIFLTRRNAGARFATEAVGLTLGDLDGLIAKLTELREEATR